MGVSPGVRPVSSNGVMLAKRRLKDLRLNGNLKRDMMLLQKDAPLETGNTPTECEKLLIVLSAVRGMLFLPP